MLDLRLESTSFLENVKEKSIISLFPNKNINAIVKEKLLTTEKVTTSEEVHKGTKN